MPECFPDIAYPLAKDDQLMLSQVRLNDRLFGLQSGQNAVSFSRV